MRLLIHEPGWWAKSSQNQRAARKRAGAGKGAGCGQLGGFKIEISRDRAPIPVSHDADPGESRSVTRLVAVFNPRKSPVCTHGSPH
uniref:Uncharacterized protein n=1 Tax=Candidatus Kentrum sp. MB TaxID=2138164 RepID=A0A451BG30_9GAMM|nr:MAG: hypothetical protein BECKMB1821G_GA0114241_111011 [Candidatus Kentron sp. MB]VFK35307.1 MAG: hypothetical protein BECKMB1821I_GA0114274_111011 [Candidatus Kentron sp. MB]VFK77231.1 MAG: hypothetical protein BECKMB1821H_GA0114242_111211 [Candidatus Kentron sp. MB]